MIKKTSLLSLIFFSLMSNLPSFAGASELMVCQSANHNYTIEIENKQDGNPGNNDNLSALVKDANQETVATYTVYLYKGIQSVSFGRHPLYLDKETNGQHFWLAGPSSNVHKSEMKILLNAGGHKDEIAGVIGCGGLN